MRSLLANRGYVDPNFPNPGKEGDATVVIYGYTPSLALGVIGALYFGLATLVAVAIISRLRWDVLTFLVSFGCAMEVVGYIMRCLSSQLDPYLVSYFVTQYFMIVVAPVFFAAAIYLSLTRLITIGGRHIAPFSPRAIYIVFISFDIVTIIIQVAGAALIGVRESNEQDPTTANNILIAGLAIQTASFAVFLVLLLLSVARLLRHKTSATGEGAGAAGLRRVVNMFFILLAAAVLVQLRTAFRLAESAQGVYGHLSSHEAFFGCLEFLPIVLAVALLLTLGWSTRRDLAKLGIGVRPQQGAGAQPVNAAAKPTV